MQYALVSKLRLRILQKDTNTLAYYQGSKSRHWWSSDYESPLDHACSPTTGRDLDLNLDLGLILFTWTFPRVCKTVQLYFSYCWHFLYIVPHLTVFLLLFWWFTQVSLDSHTKEVIIQNMKEPSKSIFNEAQEQIYHLMRRDSFPRFINSNMFRNEFEKAT